VAAAVQSQHTLQALESGSGPMALTIVGFCGEVLRVLEGEAGLEEDFRRPLALSVLEICESILSVCKSSEWAQMGYRVARVVARHLTTTKDFSGVDELSFLVFDVLLRSRVPFRESSESLGGTIVWIMRHYAATPALRADLERGRRLRRWLMDNGEDRIAAKEEQLFWLCTEGLIAQVGPIIVSVQSKV